MIQISSITASSKDNNSDICSLQVQIALELLRQTRKTFDQAHQSFKRALLMTTISAIASMVGMCLLLTNRVSEGTITTATGLVTGIGFLQLTKEADSRLKDANARLDKLTVELKVQ